MFTSANNYLGPVNRIRAERTYDRRSRYAVVMFVMMCVTLAFFPVTPPAELTSMTLNLSRMVELGLLALAAGVITFAVLNQRCEMSISSRGPLIAMMFCFWAMLSSLWSVNAILSFARAGTLLLLLYIAVLAAIYVRHTFGNDVRALSISVTGALLGSVVILVLLNVVIWGTPLHFSGANSYTGREARLVFAQAGPIEAGELLSLGIIMVASTIGRLAIKAPLAIALFWLLVLTDTRNLIAFVPIALAAAWFLRGSLKWRFVLVALTAFGVAVVLIFVFSGDLGKILPKDIATLNGRTPLWKLAAGVIAENPLLGIGYYGSRYYLMDSHFFAGNAHNSFVETLMTTGIVGLSLLLTFFIYCIKVSIRTSSAPLMAIVVLCCLGSIFSPLILSSNAYTFYLFVIVIGMSEATAQRSRIVDNRRAAFVRSAAVRR